MVDLVSIAEQHLARARADDKGRSAEVVAGDGPLRQSVIALRAGAELGEHNSPPAASLQVLAGRVRVLHAGGDQEEVGSGRLVILTHERHAVEAVEDSVFLLTTVTGIERGSHH